ncbi:MAG: hypothetical protein AAGU15_07420 [Anaerolineaceae bacterium]|mgnify:FL=1|jgi:hypothetical protein
MKKRTFIIVLIVFTALLIAACSSLSSKENAELSVIKDVTAKYWGSSHADAAAEAFVHWNEDDPAEIPPTCARCHSTDGFRDYIGDDGTEAGKVDAPAQVNDPVSCTACHNVAAEALDSVTFPSGKEVTGTGVNSVCMSCHGAMGSGQNVTKATEGKDLDVAVPDTSLIGPHYAHAAAAQQGSAAGVGFEYAGKTYVGAFQHADTVNSCTECHDPHSLHTVKQANSDESLCSTCHSGVTGWETYRTVSMSKVDYDGDGTVEPVFDEIEGVKAVLMEALNKYSVKVVGTGLGFKFEAYPYGFIDTNQDGTIDDSEGVFPNKFSTFTPRMQQAAFNLLFVQKDPGAYVHNPKYALQLMYDSIEDLSAQSGVSVEGLTRP